MNSNRRIFFNIIATYGRSLYQLIIGLFTARWTLQALGKLDYGLMGLIGGLTFIITYFNGIFSSSLGRYFSLSVGEQSSNKHEGLEHARMWFTTAVVVQTIIPTTLIIIGYPIGEWGIRCFLTIPYNRIKDCIWVWRFVCLSCYLSMISMPLNAMYIAHQYIAELTIYTFITSTLNAFFLYYMIKHPGVWLVKLAFWQCLLHICPNIIIAIRAIYLFPECRIIYKHIKCWSNIKQLTNYAFWTSWGTLGAVLRRQGIAILVNKYYGPIVNGGLSIGTTLSNHCNTLSGNLIGAFSPAVFNAWGAGNYSLARRLAMRMCKIGTLLILIFAIPLVLEVKEVLQLWLKTPPEWALEMCIFVLAMNIIDKMAVGHMICVNAKGKIAMYQAMLGTCLVLTLPLAWLMIVCGIGVYSIGISMVITMFFCAIGRVWFARKLVGLSARKWLRNVFMPILFVSLIGFAIGYLPCLILSPSFLRVCITTVLVEIILIPLSWFWVLDNNEREFIVIKSRSLFERFKVVKDASAC